MIMPMPYYLPSPSVGAQITMGNYLGVAAYISAQAATDFGLIVTGSASGDLSADNGTIELLGGGELYILNGNQSATNMNVDGTDYPLTFDETDSGYDRYSHSASFTIGNTYTVVVT